MRLTLCGASLLLFARKLSASLTTDCNWFFHASSRIDILRSAHCLVFLVCAIASWIVVIQQLFVPIWRGTGAR